jgi:hypothetical protein
LGCDNDKLNVGDERILMGNVSTYIGATIYKKVINIIVDENDVKKTTNQTYTDEQFKMTEISFYNSDYEQVAVSKISRPITLRDGSVTEIEINFDF